jgi:hypothetical protein
MGLNRDQELELERLRTELAETKGELARVRRLRSTNLKISEKGAVSFYGLSKYPVTLYADQWEILLSHCDAILAFIETNRSRLARK